MIGLEDFSLMNWEMGRGVPDGNYMFKVSNRNTRTMPMTSLCPSVSFVNFEPVNAGWGI